MIQLDLKRKAPVIKIVNMSANDVKHILVSLSFFIEMGKDANLGLDYEQDKEKIIAQIQELQSLMNNEYAAKTSATATTLEDDIMKNTVDYWKNRKIIISEETVS